MFRHANARRAVLLLMVLAVAFLWTADQGIRAAANDRAEMSATPAGSSGPAVTGESPKATPAPAPSPAPKAAPQAAARPTVTKKGQQTTITDVAGRTHTLMTDPTHAELKAAAERAKAARAAGAKKQGAQGGPVVGPTALSVAVGAGLTGCSFYDPAKGPDYYSDCPNFALSPLPTSYVVCEANDPDPQCAGKPVGAIVSVVGGLRKFVDPLQIPPIATPVGWPIGCDASGSTTPCTADYYEIELGDYTQKMHSDLPATKLRGYRQTNGAGTQFHYLGPIIVAKRDFPVRIKFTNTLPLAEAGNLFIPVDTTVMGAGRGPGSDWTNPRGDEPCSLIPKPADCYTENRATLHLHGGTTPWISDGTTHQWITPAGEAKGYPKGVSVYNVPDMPNPGAPPVPPAVDAGAGSQTFYYTNQQSARLMFYHDHASGMTRLNVYAGEAAGYLLTDDHEAGLITAGLLPAPPEAPFGIPLVIQDKTFVPPPAQLAVQDPTWDTARWGGYGNLWFPHIYMPNQNPADLSGWNAVGRWHYGPNFWPPFTGIVNGPVPNPYASVPGEPATKPGVPEPVSNTPESFMDTPLVNGVAYPYLEVPAGIVRFRILNAANDRFWNLSLWVAADKNTTTFDRTPANQWRGTMDSNPVLCDGSAPVDRGDCTEVKMVPFDATYSQMNGNLFPPNWGWTDGRDGGVPDPRTAGPAIVQIGTEGGFLPAPAVIENQPINYNYDKGQVTVLNILEHALLLGPAERADVIVDFSQYAGKTLVLYNDSPAPAPAADPRYDYYTGSVDMSLGTGDGTGGAPTTIPGYGPNTRTVMQIRVAGTSGGGNPGANATPTTLPGLQAALPTVFAASQEKIIVPQAVYNPVYPDTPVADAPGVNLARIENTELTFAPYGSMSTYVFDLAPKAIIEDFQVDYGRMNALLGIEVPRTNFQNQTSIIQGYNDPATELVTITPLSMRDAVNPGDGTQLWKLTHNGVDTHAVHFHMFHVQIVNRVMWDNNIVKPELNEVGWKDTVRMNPLEDIIIATRPIQLTLPWKLPNSFRPIAPQMPVGTVLPGIDPNNLPITFTNSVSDFGWEYVWHCHLLGHEENDMMRAMVLANPPEPPTPLSITPPSTAPLRVILAWTDNSLTADGFLVQRATDAGFTSNVTNFNVARPVCAADAGCARNWTDTTVVNNTTYWYRIAAANTVGSTASGFPTTTAYSEYVGLGSVTVAVANLFTATPLSLTFGPQLVNTTSPGQVVTVTNGGSTQIANFSVAFTGNFARVGGNNGGTCVVTGNQNQRVLAAGGTCTFVVSFTPTAAGVRTGTMVISGTRGGVAVAPITVALSGTGIAPVLTLSSDMWTVGNPLEFFPSGTSKVVTVSNTGTAPLTISGITITGTNASEFSRTTTCGASLAANTSCSITVTFTATGTSTKARKANLNVNVAAPATSQTIGLVGRVR